jgi:class 3 adenylate cyclase
VDLIKYPRILIDFLRKYDAEAIRIIKKHNGVLDKFMGDGILAYFGYNGTEEDGDPLNAIRTALEFRKQFSILKSNFVQLCKELKIKRVRRFYLKFGMNIGYIHAHYLNTRSMNSVIFMGSTLNLASRLEGIAKKDEIIISRRLKGYIKSQYEITPISVMRREGHLIKSFESEKVVYVIKGKRNGFREDIG